ncbi:hypothetical protein RND71_024622 [Anisodus tanguticus]|uniref:NADH:ubiquinone oxidoreductase 30kDa subunit domain-containing protein n=1 Tax=Anisodus tanguticus TaxID=243964 RepID=A0AAE1RQ02_9SOLA|nr:hypothetical protein RND71_024622 [Anisodus tanguticus]
MGQKNGKIEHGNRFDINTDYLLQLLCFLKLHTYTRVQVSINICGVDYPSRKQRFEVVYNLLSIRYNSRIRVQSSADEVTRISPVVSVQAPEERSPTNGAAALARVSRWLRGSIVERHGANASFKKYGLIGQHASRLHGGASRR